MKRRESDESTQAADAYEILTAEHDAALVRAFPRLYRDRHAPVVESGMGWGFACGDGWFALLWELSESIVAHASKNGLDPRARQVKEKFGALRFYVTDGDERTQELVDEAEAKSIRVCEICGAEGDQRGPAKFTSRPVRCERHVET